MSESSLKYLELYTRHHCLFLQNAEPGCALSEPASGSRIRTSQLLYRSAFMSYSCETYDTILQLSTKNLSSSPYLRRVSLSLCPYLVPIGIAGAILLHHSVDPLFVGGDIVVEFVAHLLALPLAVTGHRVLQKTKWPSVRYYTTAMLKTNHEACVDNPRHFVQSVLTS